MGLRLQGQAAIVTGAARGIGLGIAARLAAEGARVVIWDVDVAGFDPETAKFKPSSVQKVDVTDLAAIERAFTEAVDKLGKIEILINNAGVNGPVVDMWDYPVDAWNKVIAVDLTGVFFGCRAAVPHMREQGYGRIVNIASIAGKEGVPRISAYSAAKAGVIGFTKSLARELAGTAVLVNCVAPVITETELFREMTAEHIATTKARIPMGRFVTIPEIAAVTAFAASPECSFTTGFTFDVSGGRATY